MIGLWNTLLLATAYFDPLLLCLFLILLVSPPLLLHFWGHRFWYVAGGYLVAYLITFGVATGLFRPWSETDIGTVTHAILFGCAPPLILFAAYAVLVRRLALQSELV